jgi:hypothetical protein
VPSAGCRDIADRDLDPLSVVFGTEPLGHSGGQLDAGYGDASSRERQCDPACADGELESSAVTGKLGQHVDCRVKHLRGKHRAGAVVVARGNVLAEVILEHPQTVALSSQSQQRISLQCNANVQSAPNPDCRAKWPRSGRWTQVATQSESGGLERATDRSLPYRTTALALAYA